jgi:hypothetical protein
MNGGEKNEFRFFLQVDRAVDTVAAVGMIDMQYPAYKNSSDLHTSREKTLNWNILFCFTKFCKHYLL